MKKMTMALVMALSTLGACAATIPKTEQVKIRAAHDLQCDADQVQTQEIDGKTMKVTACGQERTYTEECATEGTTRCTWISHAANNTASSGGNSVRP